MERLRAVPGLTALVLLASCATGPGGPRVPARGADLSVDIEFDFASGPPIEGELGTFVLRFKNVGPYYLILRDLLHPGAGVVTTWQGSMPGTLTMRPGSDEFLLEPRDRDVTTPPVFNTSLLVPGEELVVRLRLRLFRLRRELVLNYFAYGGVDVRNYLYFVVDPRERPMRFARLPEGEAFVKALTPDPTINVRTHRTVLFPYAERVTATPERFVFPFDYAYERRGFTWERAARAIGATPEDVREVSFFAGLSMWALRTAQGSWLVGPDSRAELPSVTDLDAFCLALDTGTGGVETVSFELHPAIAQAFASESPKTRIARETGPHRNRYHAFVGRPDLLDFLGTLRQHGWKVDVQRAEGGLRLLVTH